MASCRAIAIAALIMCVGCGGGPSRDDVLRSEREFDLGRGLFGEQDFAGAYEHLLEAISLDPDNAEAHLLLANLFFLQRADFERAEHHYREALRSAEATEQRTGLPSDARNSLGVMYIHMERYDAAVEELQAASSDLMNRDPGLAKTNLGWVHILREDYQAAIEVLGGAVRQSPQLCIAWYRLGQARSELEQYERADDALSRGLDVENEDCQRLQAAWRLRGEVRAHRGLRAEAIGDLERCVELARDTEDGQACQRLLDSSATEGPSEPSDPVDQGAETASTDQP